MKLKYDKIYSLAVGNSVIISTSGHDENRSIIVSVSKYGRDNNKKFTTTTGAATATGKGIKITRVK